jgi:hypothetical protein
MSAHKSKRRKAVKAAGLLPGPFDIARRIEAQRQRLYAVHSTARSFELLWIQTKWMSIAWSTCATSWGPQCAPLQAPRASWTRWSCYGRRGRSHEHHHRHGDPLECQKARSRSQGQG